MKIIHDVIYLTQEGADDEYSYLWCQDKITDDDIKYIRADKCCKEAVKAVANVLDAQNSFKAYAAIRKAFE